MLTDVPDFRAFSEAAARGNLVPLVAERLADLLTPVAAALRLFPHVRRPFLLESAEGGENIGRYSYLGGDPFVEVTGSRQGLTLHRPDGTQQQLDGDPVRRLAEIQGRYRAAPMPGLPPFAGGAVGYVGYDAVRWVEAIPGPDPGTDELPWLSLALYDSLLAFDHLKHRILVVASARIDDPHDRSAMRSAYRRACERIEYLGDVLRQPVREPVALDEVSLTGLVPAVAESNLSEQQFCEAVQRAQRHIIDGDIFQVVLSRRLQASARSEPLTVYRALRAINPSPYMVCFDTGEAWVVGSSPEMLVRVHDGRVETRPIAGTRRRDPDPRVDAALARELLADEKERAEHLMLVDLGRNDIGRVAEFGQVEVSQFMSIERYSHVMHIVSSVTGKLRAGISPAEALFSAFPAGTVSGAPKIRAMEIIDRLEGLARGVYAGAVLYSDFAGNLNSCIAIRTLVMRDGVVQIQAGAGIVADSRPQREFRETQEKAAAALQALAWAEAATRISREREAAS